MQQERQYSSELLHLFMGNITKNCIIDWHLDFSQFFETETAFGCSVKQNAPTIMWVDFFFYQSGLNQLIDFDRDKCAAEMNMLSNLYDTDFFVFHMCNRNQNSILRFAQTNIPPEATAIFLNPG